MRLLLVEDDDPKRERIASYFKARFPSWTLEFARSVRSAVHTLKLRSPDLMLLDMSLPTFDVTVEESGGRPQGFGGMEVLRYMDRLKLSVPTIVVTGYEAFVSEEKDFDLSALADELTQNHPENYRGLVYYNSILGEWEEQLGTLIDSHFSGSKNV